MPFPEAQKRHDALLSLLYLRGRRSASDYQLQAFETYDPLADYFQLSSSDRSKKGGDNRRSVWMIQVETSRERLKAKGLIQHPSPRGVWKLTSAGVARAAKISGTHSALGAGLGSPAGPKSPSGAPADLATTGYVAQIEGLVSTEIALRRSRDPKARTLRMELDGYKCRACDFSASSKGLARDTVLEVHHVNPLADSKPVAPAMNDLLTLCPTCHRLMHSMAARDSRHSGLTLLYFNAAGPKAE